MSMMCQMKRTVFLLQFVVEKEKAHRSSVSSIMENRLSICASDVAVALFVEKPQGDGQNFFTGG